MNYGERGRKECEFHVMFLWAIVNEERNVRNT